LTPHRPPGLYEELVTRRLEAALDEIRGEGWQDKITNLNAAETPCALPGPTLRLADLYPTSQLLIGRCR
jgi:hypothetical protein